ncbi:MAG: peptidase [Faecalibacterium sp.]|jgi:penicillin-binding protein 2|nr:peptidase [Faecalibacterium sp.]
MKERKMMLRRILVLVAATALVLGFYLLRLVYLQLVRGDYFLSKASNTTSYNFPITAARGEIVDRYGRRIATNTTCYNLVVNKLLLGNNDLNDTLKSLVTILQANGESWNDTLLIGAPKDGHYTFTDDANDTGDQKILAQTKSALGLQQYATADDVMNAIMEKYTLADYAPEWQRILGGIRCEMDLEAFSNVNTFTLASGVSDTTVAMIKEHSLTISGAEIVETSVRSYPDGTILPHVIGSVGKITAEQWKVTDENGKNSYPLKDLGYNMNDLVGQSGLESVYEQDLCGENGKETVTVDSDGVITDTEVTKEAQPGKTVMLTIDERFQKSVDEALEKTILNLQQTGGLGTGAEANAGAVVVLDVKTGGILAASNYPSYDLNLYSSSFSAYRDDPGRPLINRALAGLYTPGSTFKPAVAIAAMDSGTVPTDETVVCTHRYTYYSDYQPSCTNHGHAVGQRMNFITAIQWSCNIFFYDVGRRTTSAVYDEYAQRLGLGVKTGVETQAVIGSGLSESTGHLTTTEDSNYTKSLEVQAAIGQGNTVVTPVQMATYAATIANKGTRYKTHFVQALMDTNTGEVLEQVEPVVEDQIEDPAGAFAIVEQGMIGARESLGSTVLTNYPYTIACKTGTPQRSETYATGSGVKHYCNTMMIAYGPVEDPQIAIGIVIEYGSSGAKAGELVADIFNAYYFEQSSTLSATQEGTLLP